jgi:hypothetical protein
MTSALFSAKGAAFILSLGLRPRIAVTPHASAEGAIHFRSHITHRAKIYSDADRLRWMNRAFSAWFRGDQVPGAMPQALEMKQHLWR